MKGRHTGANLAKFLTETLDKYNIKKKAIFVSVDNAKNAELQVELSAQDEAVMLEIITCED